jgi:hypothetical protein
MDNKISGTIPRDLFQLTDLGIFVGSNNSLTGSLPDTLQFATSLSEL